METGRDWSLNFVSKVTVSTLTLTCAAVMSYVLMVRSCVLGYVSIVGGVGALLVVLYPSPLHIYTMILLVHGPDKISVPPGGENFHYDF